MPAALLFAPSVLPAQQQPVVSPPVLASSEPELTSHSSSARIESQPRLKRYRGPTLAIEPTHPDDVELFRIAREQDQLQAKKAAWPAIEEDARFRVRNGATKLDAFVAAFGPGRSVPRFVDALVERAREDALVRYGRRVRLPRGALAHQSLTCEDCGKSFTTHEGRKLHARKYHLENGKRWRCPVEECELEHARRVDLRVHIIRAHCEVRPFPCGVPECSVQFATQSDLKKHVKQSHQDLLGEG